MKVWFEHDGDLMTIELPMHPAAVTFEQFCDFRTAEQEFLNAKKPAGRIAGFDKAIAIMAPGDIDKIPVALEGETVTDLIEANYQVDLEAGHELTKDRIYAHMIVMINNYKPERIPETFTFKWKKKTFKIQSGRVARVLTGRDMTTGEAIEVLEYQRRAAEATEHTPTEVGNIEFNLGLTEFAIMIRQPGEELPAGRKDRIRFLNQRKELFKTLPLDQVLDIRHFFLNALLRSVTTPSTSLSGKAPQVVVRRPKLRWPGRGWRRRRRPGA